MGSGTFRDLPRNLRLFAIATLCASVASCGGGDNAQEAVKETIRGRVLDGYISGALVCLDANGNGRCDTGEAQASADATGSYSLNVAADSTAPLIAEIRAGRARVVDEPAAVDASYRMASPSIAYSTDITPFTTLVYATGERDIALAEDLVRDELGLPIKEMSPNATVIDVDGGCLVEVDSRLDCYKGDDVDLQLVLPHG